MTPMPHSTLLGKRKEEQITKEMKAEQATSASDMLRGCISLYMSTILRPTSLQEQVASQYKRQCGAIHNYYLCLHNIHANTICVIFDFPKLHGNLHKSLHMCTEHFVVYWSGTATEPASNTNLQLSASCIAWNHTYFKVLKLSSNAGIKNERYKKSSSII